MDIIAKYYRIPTLSWRNMMYHCQRRNASGLGVRDLYYTDNVHPNRKGHRYAPGVCCNNSRARLAK
jgi:hypothetical protein